MNGYRQKQNIIVTQYTIQLYKESKTQTKRSKIDIAKEEVNM